MKQYIKTKFSSLLAQSHPIQYMEEEINNIADKINKIEKGVQQTQAQENNYKNIEDIKQQIINNIEYRFVCSDRSIFMNALFAQETLLCKQYADFNRNIIALDRYKEIRGHMLTYSMYYYFLASQNKLDQISKHLDEQGNKALYYLLFLRVVTPLFFSEGLNLNYSKDLHFHDIELLNTIVKSTWDIYGEKIEADLTDQYIIPQVAIMEGDYVIDGGAFTGDTAAFMSKMVGEKGKVFSFEPTDDSYNKLVSKNFANTVCINKGLHECKRELFFTSEDSPAANRISEEGNSIEKIDYIKMDIEGSEVAALKGADNTIKKFHPNLAICIYHNSGYDLIDVPYYLISNYGDIYNFTVRQNSIAWGESVIYAWKKSI